MMLYFELNGIKIECEVKKTQILLDLLRVDLGVTSVKKGCENGECGACTVLLDGKPVTSCMILAPQVEGRKITTLDGLLHEPLMEKLRKAFLEDGAIQCGFCTPGMLISAYSFLKENPKPTTDEVKKAIEGNICRCTGYVNIIKAIIHASQLYII
jgi:aerobic-type carbon monoxide dehydrogenase small subunit (CoxS/CutS family)